MSEPQQPAPQPVPEDEDTGTAPTGDDLTPEEILAIRESQARHDTPPADDPDVG